MSDQIDRASLEETKEKALDRWHAGDIIEAIDELVRQLDVNKILVGKLTGMRAETGALQEQIKTLQGEVIVLQTRLALAVARGDTMREKLNNARHRLIVSS